MKRLILIIALSAAAAFATTLLSAASVSDFIDFTLLGNRNSVLLPGRLYVPPEASVPSAAPRPMMVFLHGSGADGTNNVAQLDQVTDGMMQQARDRGAFLYVPQALSTWSAQSITDEVMTMIDRAIGTLNADKNRVYLTGYSLGSYGTWTMLSRYDGRFAAAIPLSGGTVQPDFDPARLVDTPIFTLHARDDATASVTNTRNVLNSILAAAHEPLPTYLAGDDPATFIMSNESIPSHTEFRDLVHQLPVPATDSLLMNPKLDLMYYEPQLGGHESLGVFNSPELYDWMFSHSLEVPEPGVMSSCLTILATMFAVRGRRLHVAR